MRRYAPLLVVVSAIGCLGPLETDTPIFVEGACTRDVFPRDANVRSDVKLEALVGSYDTIDGSLDIEGSNVRDLDPLGDVCTIFGDLRIWNSNADSLPWWGGLVRIHGNVTLAFNDDISRTETEAFLCRIRDRVDGIAVFVEYDQFGDSFELCDKR